MSGEARRPDPEAESAAESSADTPAGQATAGGERARRIRDLLDRFDRSGAHFRESGRQAALGVREALLVLEQLAEEHGHEIPALRQVATSLLLARGLVDLAIMRMPPFEDALQAAAIRLDALGILRDLLAAELMRDAASLGDERREAWTTVLRIVDEEIDRLAHEAADVAVEGPGANPSSVEWIEVEE